MKSIRKFLKSDKGATAIEYGLIAGLISVVIIGAITIVGTDLQAVFDSVGNSLETVPAVGN